MRKTILEYFSDSFVEPLEYEQTEFEPTETEQKADEDPECELC